MGIITSISNMILLPNWEPNSGERTPCVRKEMPIMFCKVIFLPKVLISSGDSGIGKTIFYIVCSYYGVSENK